MPGLAFFDGWLSDGSLDAWGVVATFLLHASVLLLIGGALLAMARRIGPRTREWVWRTALFGAFLTVPLQALLPSSEVEAAPTPIEATAVAAEDAELELPVFVVVGEESTVPLTATQDLPLAPLPAESIAVDTAEESVAVADGASAFDWRLLGWAWLLLAVYFLLRDAWLRSRLEKTVRRLEPITDMAVRTRFVALRRRAGVNDRARLLISEADGSPYVVGGRHPRVVLPRRALEELDGEELDALLAHELGHVCRRDHLWIRAERLMRALLFFHPMAWRAVKSLRGLAELDADARAVRTTGRPEALASCLTAVATWLVTPAAGRVVPAMAQPRSMLGRRVRCLLDGQPKRRTHPLWAWALCVVALAVAVGWAPRVEAEPGAPTSAVEEHTREELAPPLNTPLDLELLPDPDPIELDPELVQAFSALGIELDGLAVDLTQLRIAASRIQGDAALRAQIRALSQKMEEQMKSLLERRDRLLDALVREMK